MKIFNLKNAMVAATLLVSSNVMADYVHFDPDGTGTYYNPEALASLSLAPTATSSNIVQDLGLDGVMNSGDTFTESLTYKVNGALFASGTSGNIYGDTTDTSDLLTGYFLMTVEIVGHIENYVQYNGAAADITTDSSTWGGLNTSVFDIIFDFSNKGLTLEWIDGDTSATTVGVWDIMSGGAGGVDGGSSVTQNFELNLAFDEDTSDNHFLTPSGAGISDLITLNQAFALADADANLQGITGTSGNTINISASQNASTMRFAVPEPTSLAVLGLGLLGFAGVRRRKS